MSHMERAMRLHEGYNCSQTVFAAFAPDFGISESDALKIAAGFGGGMGDMGKTCGALTGAFMVLGLRFGNTAAGNKEAKAADYERTARFAAAFAEKTGSMECAVLTADYDPAKWDDEAARMTARRRACGGYIAVAVELLEEFLA